MIQWTPLPHSIYFYSFPGPNLSSSNSGSSLICDGSSLSHQILWSPLIYTARSLWDQVLHSTTLSMGLNHPLNVKWVKLIIINNNNDSNIDWFKMNTSLTKAIFNGFWTIFFYWYYFYYNYCYYLCCFLLLSTEIPYRFLGTYKGLCSLIGG